MLAFVFTRSLVFHFRLIFLSSNGHKAITLTKERKKNMNHKSVSVFGIQDSMMEKACSKLRHSEKIITNYFII